MNRDKKKRPGYQKTKLGWLPGEWEVERLDSLFSFKNGVNAGKEDYGKGVKFINVSEIFNNNSIQADAIPGSVAVSEDVVEKYAVKRGDVLFNRTSETQEEIAFAAVYLDDEKVVFGGFVIRARSVNDKMNDQFKKYCFQSSLFRKQVMAKGQGAVRANIGQNDLGTVKIPLPPLPEQQKIAAILSTWDRAITLTRQLLQEKEAQKKGLMQRLLMGKVRFHEFVKTQNTFQTKFGEYPEDWSYPRIEEVAKVVSVKNSNGADLPVLSCTKHQGLVDSLEYFGKQIFSKDTSTYKVVSKGQFAYATNHIEEGSIGYQNLYNKALISPMYTAFKANERVNDFFLFKLLKTPLYIHIYQAKTSASVNRRGSLRWKAFSRIHIPLPPLEEQNRIAETIHESEKEISLLESKLEELRQQKKGLMQRLLTGKVRVKVD